MTLPTPFQQYIHLSKYARWIPEEKRRETWEETVTRYLDFMVGHVAETTGHTLDDETVLRLRDSIEGLEVMPSMRAMMTAGKALELENVAGYNCAYLECDSIDSFVETMYILMCGTGVGYSVERRCVNRLPVVPDLVDVPLYPIVVQDSRAGWATALRELVEGLYKGQILKWDTSKVRPEGARLKTFGGRASGPAPLERVFKQFIEVFKRAQGRRLTSLECHDLLCHIARAVIVGGVRRSAMISLSDLDDDEMRHCKSGAWWDINPDRAYANNSAVYTSKPTVGQFMEEWKSLYLSRSGERGIFSRAAVREHVAATGERSSDHEFGTNPCSEIILRPMQFCNLTEVVVRPEDGIGELLGKVEVATILGTMQSTLLNFPFLREQWRNNCEEERLLGVSLTGIMGNGLLNYHGIFEEDHDFVLSMLRNHARGVNGEFAAKLGIPPSTAITCVKPSGTVSSLCGTSSGIHPWHAPYYIRRVRQDRKDPLTKLMIDEGVPHEEAVMGDSIVFSFPMKAPPGAVCKEGMTALGQLEHWLDMQRYYTEHKPSITVSVKEDEWLEVGAWVYANFGEMTGVSFLPQDGGTYVQAPFEEIDAGRYAELLSAFPAVKWERLSEYEKRDSTTGQQELACSAGACELF